MTAGNQCDNCRTFGPSRAPGWFYLMQQPGDTEQVSIVAALFGTPSEPLTFCTVRCVADYTYAKAVAGEAADTEPRP